MNLWTLYYIHPANITLPSLWINRPEECPPKNRCEKLFSEAKKGLQVHPSFFLFQKLKLQGMDHDLPDHAVEIGGFGGCSCTSLPSFHDALIVRGSVALWNRFDVYWGCLAVRVVWLWPLLLGKTPGAPEVFRIFSWKRDHFSKVNVIFQAIIGRGLCDLMKLLGPFFWWQFSGRGLFFW